MDTPVIIFLILFLYFLPAVIATQRKHHNTRPIVLVNTFLGWTALGWLAALVWSVSAVQKTPSEPTPETHVKCPDCAELVRREAKVCKHCGAKLVPQ